TRSNRPVAGPSESAISLEPLSPKAGGATENQILIACSATTGGLWPARLVQACDRRSSGRMARRLGSRGRPIRSCWILQRRRPVDVREVPWWENTDRSAALERRRVTLSELAGLDLSPHGILFQRMPSGSLGRRAEGPRMKLPMERIDYEPGTGDRFELVIF